MLFLVISSFHSQTNSSPRMCWAFHIRIKRTPLQQFFLLSADQIVVLKKGRIVGLRKAGRIVEAVSALCGYVESPHRGEEFGL